MGVFRQQLPPLIRLALPVVGAQLGMMLMGVVDTIMVGRFSLNALAASALANAWLFAILCFGMGLVQGIDPLVTQAHGAGREDHALMALRRGVVVGLVFSLPLMFGITFTEELFVLIRQDPVLAAMAEEYLRVQIWSLPFFFLFVALRQYLQGREVVQPIFWITVIANIFNVFANYVLIFGYLGVPELGLRGAGIASGLTRFVMFAGLALWAMQCRLISGNWLPLTANTYQWREFKKIAAVGVPVALQIVMEVLAFSGSTFLAGMLGVEILAAHTVVVSISSLSFMIPLGIAQGAVTRVGNLLGAHHFTQAKHAAWVAITTGGAVMGFSALLFIVFRDSIPKIYTGEVQVILIAASVMPIVAAYQIFDGIQVVCAGILRGMGRPLPAMVAIFCAFWVVGLPFGYYTAIVLDQGIKALWWSLSLGLALVAMSLSIWIYFRGPETHARHYE